MRGPRAERNPWRANTLEWVADSPAPHGNWGPTEPVVYRWPYDYRVEGAAADYFPQTAPPAPASAGAVGGGGATRAMPRVLRRIRVEVGRQAGRLNPGGGEANAFSPRRIRTPSR
jgi:hypothetical protein